MPLTRELAKQFLADLHKRILCTHLQKGSREDFSELQDTYLSEWGKAFNGI